MATSAEDFPLSMEKSRPVWRAELNSSVDVVQIGSECDAFFVSFRTRTPEHPALIQYLVDFRTHLLQVFGRSVDISVTIHPTKP
eukprot:5949952-Amphidinium_carterae.1